MRAKDEKGKKEERKGVSKGASTFSFLFSYAATDSETFIFSSVGKDLHRSRKTNHDMNPTITRL